MANLDRPRGFQPYGKILSAGIYESGSACYPGDMVALASDGQVDPATTSSGMLGLCVSYASGAGQQIIVLDNPDQKFVCQADESDFDAQTDIGTHCDVLATGGNSTYKISRQELDSSTQATGDNFQILSIQPGVGNAFGANCQVIVRINEHQLSDQATSAV